MKTRAEEFRGSVTKERTLKSKDLKNATRDKRAMLARELLCDSYKIWML